MTETFKERINSGEALYGTMLSMFDTPEMARILKEAGFDWFFFDTEHGYPNTDRLQALFAYAKMSGITGLIRISEINKTEVFRALDMGAAGIVCPNVETEEQARELVRLAKYAPLGERGVSMTRPHTGFRRLDAAAYMEEANRETVIVCQMESPLGVKNLDAILSVKGVDGVLIGPNDMTQSMGILNQLDHPEYLALVERVMETCSRHNKFSGISGKNLPALREYAKKGMRLLQWGTDISLLMDAIRSGLQK